MPNFDIDYHPPDAPWPDGIKMASYECASKNEALNKFIAEHGADLGARIIEIRPH